jgi:hypothetical protein
LVLIQRVFDAPAKIAMEQGWAEATKAKTVRLTDSQPWRVS